MSQCKILYPQYITKIQFQKISLHLDYCIGKELKNVMQMVFNSKLFLFND